MSYQLCIARNKFTGLYFSKRLGGFCIDKERDSFHMSYLTPAEYAVIVAMFDNVEKVITHAKSAPAHLQD